MVGWQQVLLVLDGRYLRHFFRGLLARVYLHGVHVAS